MTVVLWALVATVEAVLLVAASLFLLGVLLAAVLVAGALWVSRHEPATTYQQRPTEASKEAVRAWMGQAVTERTQQP